MKFVPQNLPVHPDFPADLVHLTIGYASVFVFVLIVERCMWKGGIGELFEGTVSGRG